MVSLNYSTIFPLSGGGGGGVDGVPIELTADTALSSGGFFFASQSMNLGIDTSSVASTENIACINSGTGKMVLFGLTTINGLSIPVNKGVLVAAGAKIWISKTSLDSAQVIMGTSVFDWIPGQEPPYIDCSYVSNGDINGIVYYYGTAGRTASFSNPYPSVVSISGTNEFYDSSARGRITNRSLDSQGVAYNTSGSQVFTFADPVKVNRFTVRNRESPFNASAITFDYWNGTAWVSVPELTHSARADTGGAYTVSAEFEIPFTQQIRLNFSGRDYACHDDIEFYGFIDVI